MFENFSLENIASFSCRGCKALSSDVQIMILLLKMNEEEFFVSVTTNWQT